jgi:hypothetical protein
MKMWHYEWDRRLDPRKMENRQAYIMSRLLSTSSTSGLIGLT